MDDNLPALEYRPALERVFFYSESVRGLVTKGCPVLAGEGRVGHQISSPHFFVVGCVLSCFMSSRAVFLSFMPLAVRDCRAYGVNNTLLLV